MAGRILIESYGCTLNQADSETMAKLLADAGYAVDFGRYDASDGSAYDAVIVNTCTVKKPTEQRMLDRLSRMSALGSRLLVAGCMASANRNLIESSAPNASILTTSNVQNVASAMETMLSGGRATFDAYSRTDKAAYINGSGSVISRIPISEGCLSNCTFCETKFARGPLNSFSEELLLKAIELNVKKGSREIELTSQDTGAYGADSHTNIANLVSRASQIEGSFRIRVGMLNPEHLHRFFDDLIDAMKSEKVYKFLHIPVQSGSDAVLKEMKRRYTVDEFMRFAIEARKKIGASIATDIIVGYPTEGDEEFEETLSLLSELRPDVVNVSKFGTRPHTEASKLKQLPNSTIKERSIKTARLSRSIQFENRNSLVGSSRLVLVTERSSKSLLGRDDSYREVAVLGNAELGSFVNVKITGNSMGCLLGKPQ